LTSDGVRSYTWDAEGKPVTIDSIGLTYDAQGRMVEQNRGGSYTQIVYGPGGGKLALMSGQTLAKAFVPLSGGFGGITRSGSYNNRLLPTSSWPSALGLFDGQRR
jgi:hypothetical protein